MQISLARFPQTIALIHEAGVAPERWREALTALTALMDLVEASRASPRARDAAGDGVGPSRAGQVPAAERRHAGHCSPVDATQRVSPGTEPLPPGPALERSPEGARALHACFDFAGQDAGAGEALGTGTVAAEGDQPVDAIDRGVDASGCPAEHKALVGLIAQHISLAMRVQAKLGEALQARSDLEAVFSHLAAALFIVDAQRQIVHLNAAAEALVARTRQWAIHGGRLKFNDARTDAAVARAVRAAACPLGLPAAIPLDLDDTRTEMLSAPLQPAQEVASPSQRPLALMAVSIDPDEKYLAWRLQQLYGLTAAESRVATALAMSKTIEDIAADYAVTEATVRTQLRSIFSKTDTGRQAELVRVVLTGSRFK